MNPVVKADTASDMMAAVDARPSDKIAANWMRTPGMASANISAPLVYDISIKGSNNFPATFLLLLTILYASRAGLRPMTVTKTSK